MENSKNFGQNRLKPQLHEMIKILERFDPGKMETYLREASVI